MAISKQIFTSSGSNAAQIDAASDWATADRIRMTDQQRARYGACNTLRVVNTSTVDIGVSLTWDVARTDFYPIRPGGIMNITAEDGKNFYGFDVYDEHATTNLAIGQVKWTMSKVLQVPE